MRTSGRAIKGNTEGVVLGHGWRVRIVEGCEAGTNGFSCLSKERRHSGWHIEGPHREGTFYKHDVGGGSPRGAGSVPLTGHVLICDFSVPLRLFSDVATRNSSE